MARPTKADAERKTNMFRIRLTDEDRLLLEAVAAKNQMDTSAWAREVLLRSAKRSSTTIAPKWTRTTVVRAKGELTSR